MKNKSKLTRRCNQIVFSFIALVLITFSGLLQASPLSKEEQAHVIIVTSPTAQKLQKLADDIGTDIYFYVEGLTGRLGSLVDRNGNTLFAPSVVVYGKNGRISATSSIPRLTVLLSDSGEVLISIGGGNVKLTSEIITNLKSAQYLSFWSVDYLFDKLDLSQFSNLKAIELMWGEIISLDLPADGQLINVNIENYSLEIINNFDKQQKLQVLHLSVENSIGYKKLENSSSLEVFKLWMGKDSIDVSKIVNLKSLAIFNVEYDSIKNVVQLNNIKSLTFWWAKDERISTISLPKSVEVFAMIASSSKSIIPLINLPNLNEVILSSDNIRGYPQLKIIPKLEDLPKLEKLVIIKSKLTSLDGIEKLTSLKYVRFEKNEITDISALFPLENLIEIDLSDSKFKRLEYIGKKPHLDILKLSDSELESVDFDAIAKYPYCSISIEFTPFEMNASDDDLDKIYNLWEKGHL
uniref:Internalin-A n=1 Tax=Aliivibrio wodanis TaxID=80852 RepID=A0A5Q4YZK5_9GAMM|nr:hypothetical protein AW0309160_01667 [Aliivibrio wodanis]